MNKRNPKDTELEFLLQIRQHFSMKSDLTEILTPNKTNLLHQGMFRNFDTFVERRSLYTSYLDLLILALHSKLL